MKVFGKKTLVFDCSWELKDDTKTRTKLESLSNFKAK